MYQQHIHKICIFDWLKNSNNTRHKCWESQFLNKLLFSEWKLLGTLSSIPQFSYNSDKGTWHIGCSLAFWALAFSQNGDDVTIHCSIQVDENLTEEERKSAWEEFENEKQGINSLVGNPAISNLQSFNFNPNEIAVS